MNPAGSFPESSEGQYPTRFYLIFALLALFSVIGLDYISWHKGESSYLFSLILPERAAAKAAPFLTQTVLDGLSNLGVPSEAVEETEDEDGHPLLQVNIPFHDYAEIEPLLSKGLLEKNVTIQKKEEKVGERAVFSWQLERGDEERLSLLFSCPVIMVEKEEPEPVPAENVAAIVIDDMGYSLETLQEICDLKVPITISVLPLSPLAWETAVTAHQKGLEVMLHLPCESLNGQEGDGNGESLILSAMSEGEVRLMVDDFIRRVPYIVGANNHMGSKVTQDRSVMRNILEPLREKNLFFVDSRTTADSVAHELALEMGIPSTSRNIFLDSTIGEDFSRQKLIELLRLSRRTGKALAIGHPFPETLRALKANLYLFEEYEVKPVSVSRIIKK